MNCCHGLTSVVVDQVSKLWYLLYIRKHHRILFGICQSEVNAQSQVVTHVSRLT